MYSSNIGTSHAAFFLAFANHLEAAGDVRRASRILRVGIDKKAQPVEELERALRYPPPHLSLTKDKTQLCSF